MWDARFITNSRPGRQEAGYTLIEILVVLALIALVLAITVGMMYGPRRNQKRLLQAGRQFSMDIRSAVQEARTRTAIITLEIRNDRYLIYIETDSPADGYQTDETLILERQIESGIGLAEDPALPQDWGSDIETLKVGDLIEFNAMGLSRQSVAIFHYSDAPVYETVCTRIYNSGDSDVYRYDPENSTWIQAPLG